MATLTDNQTIRNYTADKQAELHNAQINERYKRLQNAEADQFAQKTIDETAYTVRASVLTSNAPVLENTTITEQTPQITEIVHERVDAPVFTTEKFERSIIAPSTAQAPVEIPMQAPVYTASVAKQAQYSLSTMAKVVMAAFAAVVILMLTLICVNTQTIERKSLQIRNLEQQREELIEKNAEVQRRIQEAQSEEAITEYALSQGMIKG